MASDQAPPGWYAREGYQQYWDGAQWTPHTAPLVAPLPAYGWDQRPTPKPTGPLSAVRIVLRNYASFKGRATRSEYWWWALVIAVPMVLLLAVTPTDPATGDPEGIGAGIFVLLVLLILLPSLAVTVRRLHDTDRAGIWLLIQFVPILGPIFMFVWMVSAGSRGPNRYGPEAGG